MNISMSESTVRQLKILVERAVRPVRASTFHKRKLREKLLAQVQSLFEEEFANLGNEQSALERTAERTRQLQKSVPAEDWIERFGEWLAFQPGESLLRRALRYTIIMELAAILFLFPFVLLMRSQMGEWPTEIIWRNCPVLLPTGYLGFTICIFEASIRQLLNGQRGSFWFLFALVLVGSTGVSIMLGFVAFGVSVKTATWVPFFTVLGPLGLAWGLAHTFAVRQRYEEDWATLPIDASREK